MAKLTILAIAASTILISLVPSFVQAEASHDPEDINLLANIAASCAARSWSFEKDQEWSIRNTLDKLTTPQQRIDFNARMRENGSPDINPEKCKQVRQQIDDGLLGPDALKISRLPPPQPATPSTSESAVNDEANLRVVMSVYSIAKVCAGNNMIFSQEDINKLAEALRVGLANIPQATKDAQWTAVQNIISQRGVTGNDCRQAKSLASAMIPAPPSPVQKSPF